MPFYFLDYSLLKFYDKSMRYSEFTERLQRCGISVHEAVSMVRDFEKHSDLNSLENYVASVEREVFPNVDKIQREPDSEQR